MSELSAAAATALGVPEAIVQRSAAARADETGMSVDEVLAAWAGGETAPAPAASAPEAEAKAPDTPEQPVEAAAVEEIEEIPAPEPVIEVPSVAPSPPLAVATAPGKPPVLVGETDNPLAVLVGAVGLFVAVLLVGLVGPALPTENPGARSSQLSYSEAARRGHEIYQSVGCASCHTQMVRPVVADVDLGAVTLDDSNQVLGTRRFGPDLSNVGSRLTAGQLEAIVAGLGGHPALSLSQDDLNALVTYLLESRTLSEVPDEPPETTEEEPTES